ncbi:DUF5947 family protein [Candidatus Solirubrobacter pratensis]|uniref:DUF5947 family protein n=1 Tax=Candidatus Solirubrobacter pratensis TaxID=1298857 RepID=UPI00040252C2|nr:DUF5947 family protein [Candidatus Solirubrobacter pratensis]
MPGAAGGLMRLARRPAPEAQERCELCGAPIGAEHRHVLEVESRNVLCACRPCSILFDRGDGRLRLIGDRRVAVDLQVTDVMWEQLRLPVDVAFFVNRKAYYPSPMGPTESLLTLEAWNELEQANPILRTLAPDVEALLVNRVRGARQAWIVPIDECYALVGLIRTHWRGFTGGAEVWRQLAQFYERLDRRCR